MADEPIHIEQKNEFEYQVHNLLRNQAIWLQVENVDFYIKRTDEGIIIDAYDFDGERDESIDSLQVFDTDTKSFQGE